MGRLDKVGAARLAVRVLVLCMALAATVPCFAAASGAVFPTGLTFNPQTSGTISTTQTVTVYNIGSTVLTVTNVTSSLPQFVTSGPLPVTIQPAQWANFTVTFNPAAARTYSGQLTFTVSGLPAALKATVAGLGTSTTAKASVSVTSLNLGSTTLGSGNLPPTRNDAVSPETAVRLGSASVFTMPFCSSACRRAEKLPLGAAEAAPAGRLRVCAW